MIRYDGAATDESVEFDAHDDERAYDEYATASGNDASTEYVKSNDTN